MKRTNCKGFTVGALPIMVLIASFLVAGNAYSHGAGHHKMPKKKTQYPYNEKDAAEKVHSGHGMHKKAEKVMDHSSHGMKKPAGEKMDRSKAHKASRDVVAVMNAWVREAVPESPVIGGYLTLVNGGEEAVTVANIESTQFDSIEIHKMAAVDGMMQMQRIDDITIDAGNSLVLKPGGKHLMMMGPEKDLVTGDSVEVVLHFTNGAVQVINLPVKK